MTLHQFPTADRPTETAAEVSVPLTSSASLLSREIETEHAVGIAVGMLLTEHRCSPSRALGLLIDAATHADRSLPAQAQRVIDHRRTAAAVRAAGTRRRERLAA